MNEKLGMQLCKDSIVYALRDSIIYTTKNKLFKDYDVINRKKIVYISSGGNKILLGYKNGCTEILTMKGLSTIYMSKK